MDEEKRRALAICRAYGLDTEVVQFLLSLLLKSNLLLNFQKGFSELSSEALQSLANSVQQEEQPPANSEDNSEDNEMYQGLVSSFCDITGTDPESGRHTLEVSLKDTPFQAFPQQLFMILIFRLWGGIWIRLLLCSSARTKFLLRIREALLYYPRCLLLQFLRLLAALLHYNALRERTTGP
jgi:hypothetical protein